MKILIDDKIPFIRGVFEPYAEVVYKSGARTVAEDVRDADALITRTRTICDRTLLEGSKVSVIATATIGYDHIDTAWCESNGISWTNAPGCNSWSVKQYISSVLVTLAARHSLDLGGLTVGVVGAGNVGSKVAEAAGILGCRVLLNDPPRAEREGSEGFVDLDTLIAESDIITVHVPLTDAPDRYPTRHLFDEALLGRLGGRILINSSRGSVVDGKALKSALKRGILKAAVLDVWEGEPDLDPELVSLLDISTPHIAGYSADGKANGTTMSVRAVAGRLGLPLTDWTASGLPAPAQALCFEIDAAGKTRQEVLAEAILHTYDVQSDSDALRKDLSQFERLRGDYQVRREPTAFSVALSNASGSMAEGLAQLGFKVTIK